jgi:dUTP pyrophosphatase
MEKSILDNMERPKMVFEKTHPNAQLPKKAHPTDVGWDIFAVEDQVIEPKSSAIVKTGLKLAFLEEGYWIKIESRSGMAFNYDVIAFQGVVDNSFRGEIQIKLFSFSNVPYNIKTGDRVAQIAINFSLVDFGVEWGKVKNTDRGSGGFGSTGK